MIRVLIAEDDPQCFLQMEQFIRDYSSETGRAFQITRYDNGEDLVEQYRPEFDLLLLDVDMPFMDGMTAAGHIRKMDPEVVIVFVTNLAQYAIQGYSVNALDYILKPLNYFSFSQRLTRCLRYVKKREDAYITVAVKGGTLKLEIGDIYCIWPSTPKRIFWSSSAGTTARNSWNFRTACPCPPRGTAPATASASSPSATPPGGTAGLWPSTTGTAGSRSTSSSPSRSRLFEMSNSRLLFCAETTIPKTVCAEKRAVYAFSVSGA